MKKLATAIIIVFTISGCTVTNVATQGFTAVPPGARVVVMPPDIKYYRVTASGISEPAPDWTDTARASFDDAFGDYIQRSNLNVSFADQNEMSEQAIEYDKLHSAVGNTIIVNHFGLTKLPTKLNSETEQHRFDWSLGDGVNALAPDGDYALFVFYRDFQASGGRVGMAVFAAIFNVAIYTGHQGGFASLVDLKTGDVVWFNNVPASSGNLRSEEGADSIVKQLFAELADPA
ncbi:MAG: hypothetical protein AAF513_18945 [Pseudomonadota bacterium]